MQRIGCPRKAAEHTDRHEGPKLPQIDVIHMCFYISVI
jgi:hypothetical protein